MAYPLADAGNAIPPKITDPIRFIGEESDRPGEISAMISSVFGEERAVTGDSVALRRRIEVLKRRVSQLSSAAVNVRVPHARAIHQTHWPLAGAGRIRVVRPRLGALQRSSLNSRSVRPAS